MNKKNIILVITIGGILIGGIAAYMYFNSQNEAKIKAEQEEEVIEAQTKAAVFEEDRSEQIAYAKRLYEQYKAAGGSFASGPCLANGTEWAIDVVHNPRQPIDDDPSYQCSSYVSGQAKYFVELDTEGNVLRAE